MKLKLPQKVEWIVLAVMAVLCAIVLSGREHALALIAFPLILIPSLMGAWRTGKLSAIKRRPARRARESSIPER